MNRNDEIEAFKQLNLTKVAASRGYELVGRVNPERASSVTMAHADGDKIVVARSRSDGHWIYFSVRDQSDAGSVIDFLQRRGVGSLGDVRKELRPWIGGGVDFAIEVKTSAYVRNLQPIERDIAGVRARFEGMSVLPEIGHPYLCDERRIPRDLLFDPRFAGRVRIDARSNAVFPHYNLDGLCGFEVKNLGFTGFAKGGAKGLWASHIRDEDQRLVVSESAIDGFSYAAINGAGRARFVSLAGQFSPEQLEFIVAAAEKLPAGEVVLALDNDKAGRDLEARLRAALKPAGKPVRTHTPPVEGQDWNEVLKSDGHGVTPASPSPE